MKKRVSSCIVLPSSGCASETTVLPFRASLSRSISLLTRIVGYCISGFSLSLSAGNPVRYRTRREADIASTNWTALADEWIAAKARAAEKMDVALLPFNERFRELPPTAETFVVNGTSVEQMARVKESHCWVLSRFLRILVFCFAGHARATLHISVFQKLAWGMGICTVTVDCVTSFSLMINRRLSLVENCSALYTCTTT